MAAEREPHNLNMKNFTGVPFVPEEKALADGTHEGKDHLTFSKWKPARSGVGYVNVPTFWAKHGNTIPRRANCVHEDQADGRAHNNTSREQIEVKESAHQPCRKQSRRVHGSHRRDDLRKKND